jgi:3-oxoacyl-ACP reductase-like protein
MGRGMAPPPSPGASKGGAPPDPTIIDRLKGAGGAIMGGMQWAGDRNLFDGLAMGFNSMRMNPDAAIAASAQDRMKTRNTTRQQAAQANKTAEFLRSQGREDLAAMIERNPALGQQMLLAYQKAQLNPPDSFTQVSGADLGLAGDDAGKMFNRNDTSGKISAIGGAAPTSICLPLLGLRLRDGATSLMAVATWFVRR